MPELRPLQLEAINPLRSRWIHADPPGSGKTPVGLSWLKTLGSKRSLIVCPSNVVHHWGNLATQWYPETTVFTVPKGTPPKKRSEQLNKAVLSNNSIYVTSYALFRQDDTNIIATHWDAIIFDEAHRLKNRKSLLHKAAVKLARRTTNIELCTGSPILGTADEAWSYLHILDQTYTSFWRWAANNFHINQESYGGYHPVTQVGAPLPGALERMAEEFAPWLVVRPEEVMLPHLSEPQRIVYSVDMTPKERSLYSNLKRTGMAIDEDTTLEASTHLAKLTRLRQMASSMSALFSEVAGSKVEALVELVNDLPKQVLVFVSFKATATVVVEALKANGINAVSFTGDDDEERRTEVLSEFRSHRAQALVGTYGALAEGIDGLQYVAHHVVLLDHDWVPEIERQAIRRLHRDGQAYQVVIHDFVFNDTVDQKVAEIHAEKIATSDVLVHLNPVFLSLK